MKITLPPSNIYQAWEFSLSEAAKDLIRRELGNEYLESLGRNPDELPEEVVALGVRPLTPKFGWSAASSSGTWSGSGCETVITTVNAVTRQEREEYISLLQDALRQETDPA